MAYLPAARFLRRPLGRGIRAGTTRSGLSGLFDAVGEQTTKVADPEAFLVAQVNRFTGAGVPDLERVADAPFPGDRITPPVAFAALLIVLRRAMNAVATIPDDGSQAMVDEARRIIGSASSDPDMANMAFAREHVEQLGSDIRAYGDALGLAPAKLSQHANLVTVGAIGIAALVGGFLFLHRRR